MSQNNPKGLTSTEVEESRQRWGENVITPAKDDSAWQLLLEKFNDPIIRILILAAVLSIIIGIIHRDFTESLGIISAILLATMVGFIFEWDAMRRFRRLNRVNDDTLVKVIRDADVRQIPRRDVVVGDVVHIESGEMIPADGTLIEAVSLRMNESTLTGELEVEKSCDEAHFDSDATYPTNRVLRGTTVSDGYGVFRVDAVGDSSEAGRVSEQATAKSSEPTPLTRQLTRLSKLIGYVGISLAIAIFAILTIKGIFWGDMLSGDWLDISQRVLNIFMISVAIIVMSVPEGLPMSITLSLAMSMRRMLKTNNLVRRMHACETMGAVTVICTDKTGTLTQNRMRVAQMHRLTAEPTEHLAECIALNTTAFLDGEGAVIGNPTEGALLEWLHSEGFDYNTLRNGAKIIDRLTFSTERKYMATIIQSGVSDRRYLFVKGAPEIVMAMSSGIADKDSISEQLLSYQNRALRTLAIASTVTELEDCEEAIRANNLTLDAIVAIEDPIREDVPKAVEQCLRAGIDIKIVTGDTPATAREIARQIGLWDSRSDSDICHITGTEFAEKSDEELLELVADLKIISRARPLDKQRLVQLLQRRGEVVAVTGDGTNDAPALNFANVGLSMGSGTSVAKDASDITLIDDSFSSIVTAVMWGRSLYRNIQRFILFQLTINFVAIVICLFGALFGTVMPLTIVQILWVNIIMDTFAAMAMASLPPREDVLNERPRGRDEFIITRSMALSLFSSGIVMIAVLLSMLFMWDGGQVGITLHHLTIFFSTFIFFQFWNMFNAKGFKSRDGAFRIGRRYREFYLILIAIAIGQVIIVEIGGELFRTTPLSLRDWAYIIAGTSLLAIAGEAVRYITSRITKGAEKHKA